MNRIKTILTVLLLLCTFGAYAQVKEVRGVVLDALDKYPLEGAAVQIKGNPTGGTVTNALGEFVISAKSDDILVISYINYKNTELPIGNQSNVEILMEEDAIMLEQTIVIGYGTAKKISSVVGSASTVKADVIANRPSANIGDALQGQVAGLQVISSTGEPMSTVSMRIRGVNSISASSSPLFILDGSPVGH